MQADPMKAAYPSKSILEYERDEGENEDWKELIFNKAFTSNKKGKKGKKKDQEKGGKEEVQDGSESEDDPEDSVKNPVKTV